MTQELTQADDRTFFDEVQSRWSDATPETAEVILWITPFPFVSVDRIRTCLDEMRAKWGPKIEDAINGEMAEFDATMRDFLDERRNLNERVKEENGYETNHAS